VVAVLDVVLHIYTTVVTTNLYFMNDNYSKCILIRHRSLAVSSRSGSVPLVGDLLALLLSAAWREQLS